MTAVLRSMPVTAGRVVDTRAKLDAAAAARLYAAGVRAVVRYVPLPGNSAREDLDATELAALTGAGHVVVAVQHPREPEHNTLSAETGAADAVHAIEYCRAIGYVPVDGERVALALDMEGVRNPAGAMPHARAWVPAALAAGYQPLVYVGYDSGLTTEDLAELAALGALFWCDAAPFDLRPAPPGGYVLHQRPQTTVSGVGIDEDELLTPGAVWGLGAAPANDVAPEDVEPHVDDEKPHAA